MPFIIQRAKARRRGGRGAGVSLRVAQKAVGENWLLREYCTRTPSETLVLDLQRVMREK